MLAATLPQTQVTDDEILSSPPALAPVDAAVVYTLENLESAERSTTFTPKDDLCFGRDAVSCKMVFADVGTLSRVHCKVFTMNRDVFVVDLSSNGTFVNGKVVGKQNRKMLRTGDILSLLNPQLPESTRLSWRFIAPDEIAKDGVTSVSALEKVYSIGQTLGNGNFATVYLGTHRMTGRKVAVKIVEKRRFGLAPGDFDFSSLQSEVEILRKMDNENIIRVWDAFDDPRQFTMVLELVNGGDLFDYIAGRVPNPFTEIEARVLFLQLLNAMLYMHHKDVVHRDLKPENILVAVDPTFVFHRSEDNQRNARHIPVDRVTLKVTDFGLAKFCTEHDKMTTMCGTPQYLAPEVQNPDDATKKAQGYSWSVDVWSLGVILVVMLTGRAHKDLHLGDKSYRKYLTSFSPECGALIELMLKLDPRERADLKDICDHPWLKGEDIRLRDLAIKKDRLVMSGTMILPALLNPFLNDVPTGGASSAGTATVGTKQSRVEKEGTATDVESDDDQPNKKRRVENASTSKIITWYWKKELSLPDGDSKAWQAYAEEDCDRLEKARARDAKTAKVGHTSDYRISFEGMFQYSTKDPTKQRPVKRVEV